MFTIAAFIVTLGILVIVHEFGHYWVARRCGVHVLRFSVGFGKPWLSRVDRQGTEWTIAPIPLGGYVSMLDERNAPVPSEMRGQTFNAQPVGCKIAIVAAGPVANFLLAILLYGALGMSGTPVRIAQIAEPPAGTPAALAGMHEGLTLTAVGNRATAGWADVHWELLRQLISADGRLTVDAVDAGGLTRRFELQVGGFSGERLEGDVPGALGLRLQALPLAPVVGGLARDSAAARAGLQAGDRIVSIDGVAVVDWEDFAARVRLAPLQKLDLRVVRDGAVVAVDLQPDAVEQTTAAGQRQTIGRAGVQPAVDQQATADAFAPLRLGPLDSLWRGTLKTWDTSVFSLQMLGRMLVGDISPRHLSGPITIADYAGKSASFGLASFIGFLALVSISLGVLNLLPVPLLDGGHIMYHLAEFATGRPVSERVMEIGQRIGIAALASLMLVAFYNDIYRLLAG